MGKGEQEKRVGRVRWFNADKGYGFVVEEGREGDVFLHFSAIQVPGYKCLPPGQRVLFTAGLGPRGLTAQNVVPICEDEPAVSGELEP